MNETLTIPSTTGSAHAFVTTALARQHGVAASQIQIATMEIKNDNGARQKVYVTYLVK